MGKLELVMETEKVSMYSPKYDGETLTEFEKFLSAHQNQSHPQLIKFFDAIVSVIEKIGETGAYERYFRPEGGNVKAVPLYITISRINKRIGKMRLYCLRLSDKVIILGNGVVTTAETNDDDPAILTITGELRDIEKHIRRILKQANADCEDFAALKQIIETITI